MTFDDILSQMKNCFDFYKGKNPYPCGKTFCAVKSVDFCINSDCENVSIVFKGTDSKAEWAQNFMFCKKKIPYGFDNTCVKVHSGFMNAYNNEKVRDRILSLVPKSAKYIKVTGHSRGGALAVLCCADLKANFPKADIENYIYGCPRVGNKEFAKNYDKNIPKTVRVENGNDFVTKIPPVVFGYRHVGSPFRIGAKSIPFVYSLKDHKPGEYYKSLLSLK